MSFAPGQLINPNDSLTCCGGTPEVCYYASGASGCPTGFNPHYCCMANGTVTSALIMPDDTGSNTGSSYCPVLGSLKTSNMAQCSSTPAKSCCYQGQCYPSKYYSNSNCYDAGAYSTFSTDETNMAGVIVSDCKQCPKHVTCCQQQPLLNACYRQPFCNDGDLQVSQCNQCPFPTVPPLNFQSKNMNWMK